VNEVRFSLIAWSAWAPGLDSPEAWRAWLRGQRSAQPDGAPAVDFVPPLQRRRLSRLARMVFHVAEDVAPGEQGHLPVVFGSRHGETRRTLGLLTELAADEAPSPTDFSLSVHNSTPGLHAILTGNRNAHTAIGAGPETLFACLLEAGAQLRDAGGGLLLLWADEPPPDLYLGDLGDTVPTAALGLRLGDDEEGAVPLRLSWSAAEGTREDEQAALRAVMTVLLGESESCVWNGERRVWRLERADAGTD
jgi:hypothetical protein